MKCYFTIDPKTLKKVFIPMCYGTIYSQDKRDCYCSEPLTEHYFAKNRFEEVVKEKNKTIESQQSEIKHLNNIIEKYKLNQ